MKRFPIAVASMVLVLAGCSIGQSQNQPQVIVVPTDEMSRQPSLGPATNASPTPAATEAAAASATPVGDSMMMASVPSEPATAPAGPRYSYSSCNVNGPYVAMTFDDGPSAELTPKLLDILKARNIKATFFMVGQNVVEHPEIVQRMVAEGHEVGNHSWNHPALTKLSADGVRKQLDDTSNAIEKACGVRPTVMRPPYGATNAALNKRINEQFGMKVILWSVDPLDWKYRNSERVKNQIVEGAQPGGIILSHDIHATTVAAMPATLDALLAKGYKFVTVAELVAMDRPKPAQLVKKEEPKPAKTENR